jgi:hypothetical protein
MKIQLLTLTLLISISIQYPQKEVSAPLPNFKGLTLTQVKKNQDFTILTKTTGDLNNDHVNDLALVLETKDSIYEKRELASNEYTKGKGRILLVFLNQNGKQVVHTQNNDFIVRAYESNYGSYIEPLLYIENNELIISNVYIRANQSYTFQFKNDDFFITSAQSSHIHGYTYTNTIYDFLNQKLITNTGLLCEEEENTSAVEFKATTKALSEFNAMYEWEVIPDHFL